MDAGSCPEVMEWLAREVLVHEAPLRSWLKRIMDANDVEDIVQESYCRIACLTDVSHIRSGRAYLFTTARMLVLERIRRSRVVSIDTAMEIDKIDLVYDAPSPEQIVTGRHEFQRVKRLIDALPERCRKVFRMRKIDGLSQRQVAAALGISEHTVENDVAKGLKLILKVIADGEQQAEIAFTNMGQYESARQSSSNQ